MKTQSDASPMIAAASSADTKLERFWPLLALLLLLPIWGLGALNRDIWTPDEPREYDIAYNMLQSGDLVTPRLAGEPFLEKPPLSYWVQSTSMRALGPSITAARLPNLLWAALTVLCIGLLAGDMASERNRGQAALIAALTCGTMLLVQQVQIWLATDAPLLAMTAASLLSAWRLAHAAQWRQQLAWSFLLGTCLAAAFLTKNGFGLMVPCLTLAGWMIWDRRLKQLLQWRWWAAAAWFGVFAGSWLIALYREPNGPELLHTLLWDNLAGRFVPMETTADLGHQSAHWTYLLLIPVYAIPWTFALLAAARWSVDSTRRPPELTSGVRFCIASVVLSCSLLVISNTARGVYFAPALLGLPVLLSLWLTDLSATPTPFERSMLGLTRHTLRVLAVLFAVAVLLIVTLSGARAVSLYALLLIMALIALLLIGTRLARQASPQAAMGIVGATGLFLASLGVLEIVAFPTLDRVQDLAGIVAAAEPTLKSGPVATYCGDETIRATLDHAIDLRLQDVCGTEEAERLLRQHDDQQFLVLLAPPRGAQRLSELFPNLDVSRMHAKPPRSVQRLVDLESLGLQPVAQWSAPGGRKYALYGKPEPHATR
jgi:4-amino-4-deoxy-L-arabinose transferase